MLLHINPTRQRGKRTGSLARASGWYMTFFAAGVITWRSPITISMRRARRTLDLQLEFGKLLRVIVRPHRDCVAARDGLEIRPLTTQRLASSAINLESGYTTPS